MKPSLESLEQRLPRSADPFAGLANIQAVAPYIAQLQAFQQGFVAIQSQLEGVFAQEIAFAQQFISPQSYLQIEGEFAALQYLQGNWMDLVQDPQLLFAYAAATNI